MSASPDEEIREWLNAELTRAFHERIVRLGYWCPRCQCEAYPNRAPAADEPIVGGDGWCPICGLNPLVEGPVSFARTVHGLRLDRAFGPVQEGGKQ